MYVSNNTLKKREGRKSGELEIKEEVVGGSFTCWCPSPL